MSARVLVTAAILVAVLPGPAAAQGGGGVKGGLSFADIPNLSNAFSAPGIAIVGKQRLGFAAGGFATIGVGGGFMVQPEVLFTQKGVKIEGSAAGLSAATQYKLDFIDVPVLARLTFGRGVKGYVFGGPSVGFKMNAKATSDMIGEGSDEDISDEVESFEFAVVFGGGIEIGPFLVEARLSEGLTNLATMTEDEDLPKMKSRTFLILAGLRF